MTLSISIPSLETAKVNRPNRGDNRAIFNPPAKIDGATGPPDASIASNAPIRPMNAPINPRVIPKTPQSLICFNILLDTSALDERVRKPFAIK